MKRFGMWLLLPLILAVNLWASMAEAYDISGTVSYGGSKSGRVYLTVYTPSGPMGTSIPAPGAFTIKGVPTGNYTITAFMDALGTGSRHVSDPFGNSSLVTVTSVPVTGITMNMTDPGQLTTIQPPTGLRAFPGDSAALVQWNFLDTGNGSQADSYSIYYDTNPSVTPANATFSKLDIPADGDRTDLLLSSLANGSYYFIITAKSGAVTSSPSAVVGPVSIGPLTGGYSVSGSVTLPAVTSAGPLYLAIADKAGNNFPTYINSPVSPQTYSLTGVPNGTYQVYAVLDMNNNGLIDSGDYKTNDRNATIITVSNGAVTNADVVIDAAGSAVNVMTQHRNDGAGESYSLSFNIYDGFKRPVTVALNSGPNITGPIDIGLSNWGGFFSYMNIGPVIPAINDTYSFAVSYSDGSSETISGMVTGVVTALATPTSPLGSSSYNATPTFTWAAPTNAAPPANSNYALILSEQNGLLSWNSNQIPINQTSALFNFDGTATQSTLNDGKIYDWIIVIFDPQGNHSWSYTSFSFPGTGGISPASLPDGIEFGFYSQQLTASGGNGSYTWSAVTGVLPSGLSLDPNTGIISGTPTIGTSSFTIQATDTALPPFTTSRFYTLKITPSGPISGPPTITTSLLPDTAVNNYYDQTIGVIDGIPPYTFTYTGTLPPGLTLSTTGQLSGTATTAGSYSFTVTVQDTAAVSSSMPYTIAVGSTTGNISGTINYSGSKSGRIYITLQTGNGTLGTSINWPTETTYTIRGVPNGSYTLNAFMDSLNLGTRVQISPDGSAAAFLSGSNVSGLNISLTDPAPIAPQAPTNVSASPSDSSILIGWDPARSNGSESADSYDIYWGTSAAVSKVTNNGSSLNLPAGADSPAIIDGLTNGSSLYFIVIPKSGGVEGSPSTAVGPYTIGASTGGNTVSGTLNYSGTTATGPLYVIVVNPMSKGADGIYYTKIANPGAVNSFSVSGIPNGSYAIYSVIDMNNDRLLAYGDISNTDDTASHITLNGTGQSGLSLNLGASNARALITTNHGKQAAGTGEWFNIDADLQSQLKKPVTVTLTAAPASMQLAVPMDIGLDSDGGWRFHFWANNALRPTVGDTYTFSVTYSDGSTDPTLAATVSGVNDSFPTNVQISTPISTVPIFNWSAPTIPPAFYLYSVWVGNNSGGNYWDSWDIPSSITSVTYGSSGNQAQPLILNNQYNWNVSVRDQSGNRATINSAFMPTNSGTPVITWATPAAITYGTSLSAIQLNATASVPGTFSYSPAAGTILNAGAQTLSVTFTPTDFISYTTATTSVTLTVNQATPTITWATPAAVTYGTPLSAAQQNAAASVPGTFAYSPIAGTVLNAGTQNLNATFTPTDAANYTTAAATVSQAINPVLLTVTANNASKTYGAANPLLTVTYSGFAVTDTAASLTTQPTAATAATAASAVGTYPITASGGVSTNYTFTYVPGTLTVNKAALTVSANNATKSYSAANPLLTVTYNGFAGTDTVAGLTTQPTVSTSATTASPAGTYPITASGGASSNYTFTYIPGTLTIIPAVINLTATATTGGAVTPPGATAVNSGTNQSYTITANPGYHILDVKVDGISQGAIAIYSFTNVTTPHTIDATFAVNTFTITATAGTFGTITPTGAKTLNQGASQTYAITPDSGYVITDVKVDGLSLDRSVVGSLASYSFNNLSADHTIEAYFGPDGILDPTNTTGVLSISDALIVLAVAMGDATLTPEQLKRADAAPLVNGVSQPDGKVDLGDVLLVLRRVVGLVNW